MAKFYEIFAKRNVDKIENQKNEQKPKIIIDHREKNSLVPSELVHLGCAIEFANLHIGDFIVKDVIIERKTVKDFLSSMINKRLISQLNDLQQIQNKILIIEGIEEQELYNAESGINENAIRGFMLSIILNHNIPIILTKNYADTAKFLMVLAKKQEKENEIGINAKKKSRDVREQMQFILEGFPGIGPKSAKKLLSHFKTIKNTINAPKEDLQKCIGKKSEIFRIIHREYQ